MIPRDKDDWNRVLGGGLMAGIVGGVAIGLLLVITTMAQGHDVWMALKGSGTPFLGSRAMQPGFDAPAVLIGVLSELAVSIAWALPFAAIVYGLSKPATLVLGAVWGLVVWIGMYYAVLPLLGLQAMAASVPAPQAALQHGFFGLAVAVGFLPYQRHRRVLLAH